MNRDCDCMLLYERVKKAHAIRSRKAYHVLFPLRQATGSPRCTCGIKGFFQFAEISIDQLAQLAQLFSKFFAGDAIALPRRVRRRSQGHALAFDNRIETAPEIEIGVFSLRARECLVAAQRARRISRLRRDSRARAASFHLASTGGVWSSAFLICSSRVLKGVLAAPARCRQRCAPTSSPAAGTPVSPRIGDPLGLGIRATLEIPDSPDQRGVDHPGDTFGERKPCRCPDSDERSAKRSRSVEQVILTSRRTGMGR